MSGDNTLCLSILVHTALVQMAFCRLKTTAQTCARLLGSVIRPAVRLAHKSYLLELAIRIWSEMEANVKMITYRTGWKNPRIRPAGGIPKIRGRSRRSKYSRRLVDTGHIGWISQGRRDFQGSRCEQFICFGQNCVYAPD